MKERKMKLPTSEWKKLLKKMPMIVVDGVVVRGNGVLLMQRTRTPYKGHYTLPGGFVDFGETLAKAAVREVREETGLKTRFLAFSGVYDDPKRDPRGHIVSVGCILQTAGGRLRNTEEGKNPAFFPVNNLPQKMGYDHRVIVKDAFKLLHRNRKKR